MIVTSPKEDGADRWELVNMRSRKRRPRVEFDSIRLLLTQGDVLWNAVSVVSFTFSIELVTTV